MKKLFVLLAALMMCPFVSYSTDLVLNNGAAFNNIQVTETTPIGINFVCNGAAGWADFMDMPLDEATSFGYDPMKAAAFQQQLQANQGSTPAGQCVARRLHSAAGADQCRQCSADPRKYHYRKSRGFHSL